MCPSIWMATNGGIAAFRVYPKSLKINLLASVRRLGQAGMGHKRAFCPNRKCQQDGSVNLSLGEAYWAIGFRPPPAGSGGAVRGAVWQPFLQGTHIPLLSAAIQSRQSFACSRARVASGSGSCIALDSYSAAFLSSSARVFSEGTIFMREFTVAAL